MTVAATAAPHLDLTNLRAGVNDKFYPLFWDTNRYLVLMGGAGSGKSRFAAQDAVLRCMTEPEHCFLILRKVGRTLRASCFAEVQNVVRAMGWSRFVRVNKSDMTITFLLSGSVMLFAGLDDPEKLKSIASITSVWIEEATEFSEADFNQVDIRLRGETRFLKRITLTFNPISIYHWLRRRFWETACPDAMVVVSTYLDNRFLDAAYCAVLEGYKDQDETFWRVYAKGEWGVFKGLIYTPWPNAEAWPARFDSESYGLDFGFNNPTALIHRGKRDKANYLTELIYESGLTTEALGRRMIELGVSKVNPIYCDAAEPDRIQALCDMGFNCIPADKGPGSVAAGIMTVKASVIFTKPENTNLNRECSTYKWAEDKDGRALDQPVKINDHAMDAVRYDIHTDENRPGAFIAGGLDVAPTDY